MTSTAGSVTHRPGSPTRSVREVRAVRETMAVIAEATAVEPPAELRAQVLAQIAGDPVRTLRPGAPKRRRWTTSMLAAAAAVAVGLGAVGVGMALRPSGSAVDRRSGVRRSRRPHGVGRDPRRRHRDRRVLPRTGLRSAGDEQRAAAASRARSTRCGWSPRTARTRRARWTPRRWHRRRRPCCRTSDASRSLAFTVEPPGGSTEPTGPAFAELPLV